MAGFVELIVEQGATLNSTINVNAIDDTPQNLASYTANSQMRKSYYSTTAYNFNTSVSDAANGIITLAMTAANTALLKPGRYVFDVTITDSFQIVTRIVEGIVSVLPSVTRN